MTTPLVENIKFGDEFVMLDDDFKWEKPNARSKSWIALNRTRFHEIYGKAIYCLSKSFNPKSGDKANVNKKTMEINS